MTIQEHMNKTLKLLLIADIFTVTGFGLIDPIISIFVADRIDGGTIAAAGIASSIFLIVKSFVQLPFSKYIDKNHASRVRWLIVGGVVMTVVPFLYAVVGSVYPFYFAQVLYGIGSGLAYPTWLSLWSTNLDKGKESYEWTLYSTVTSLGVALAGTVGGLIADAYGFPLTFSFVGVLAAIGTLLLFRLGQKKGL